MLSLWDPKLVEEALNFIEKHKVTPVSTDNGFSSKNNFDYQVSPFKRIASQINFDLQSPDTEDFYTPESPKNLKVFMDLCSLKEKQVFENNQDQEQFLLFPECDKEIDKNHIKKNDLSGNFLASIKIIFLIIFHNFLQTQKKVQPLEKKD